MSNHEPDSREADATRTATPAEPARFSRVGENRWTAWALLIGSIGAVYGGAAHAPFFFDDRISVVENPTIVKLWPLLGASGAAAPLTPLKDSVTAGRPLVNLSLAINYRLGGLDPLGYHVVNMIFHALSAMLLWTLVRRTLGLKYFGGRFERVAGSVSLLVALIWAVHPLATEAVEYVSQRTELMMGLCYLATLCGSLNYFLATSRAARTIWLALSVLACLSGMACKEVMASAPLMVLLFERTFVSGSFRRAWRESWPLYVGLVSCWGLLLALNLNGPRSQSAGFHLGLPAYAWWFTQAKVLVIYLKLALWPWPLVIHYEMPYLTFTEALPWLLLTAVLLLTTLALLWRRKAVGYLGAWIFVILSPTLMVPLPSEIAAERRMYLPLAALVTLLVVGVYVALEHLRRVRPADARRTSRAWTPAAATTICGLALATALGLVSIRRLAAYRDLVTLWQDAADHQPDNPVVLVSLGAALTRAGRSEEAIQPLRRALQLQPDSPALGIHKQLGVALSNAGRPDEAIEDLKQALRLQPDAAGVDCLLGATLINAGRPQEAIEALRRATRLQPEVAEIRDNFGVALLNAGRPEEAIDCFQQALRLQPDYLSAHANLALAYARVGRSTEAIATAEKALALARSQRKSDDVAPLRNWLMTYRNQPTPPQADP